MAIPNVYIIAGPNGAGKTTFALEFLPSYAKCKHFVNADLIAQGLAAFGPELVRVRAGRILLEQVDYLASRKLDFGFESTLSGKAYVNFLKKLKENGYIIHIFYLWVPDVQLSLMRVKDRVEQGGHHIPAKDIRRRFNKSIYNFINYYSELADFWTILDNAGTSPRLIASAREGIIEVSDGKRYDTIIKECTP